MRALGQRSTGQRDGGAPLDEPNGRLTPVVPGGGAFPGDANVVVTHRRAGVVGLVASLVVVAVVAGVGASWTDTARGSWYDRLAKPSWTPPGWVFGFAWTLLYAMMAVAAWSVARRGLRRPVVLTALAIYAVHLVLNLGWTFVFFNQQLPGWALLEIVVLDAVVVVMIGSFWGVRRRAAILLLPYAGWLAFATALNTWIVFNN